jgi:hypothetical protein
MVNLARALFSSVQVIVGFTQEAGEGDNRVASSDKMPGLATFTVFIVAVFPLLSSSARARSRAFPTGSRFVRAPSASPWSPGPRVPNRREAPQRRCVAIRSRVDECTYEQSTRPPSEVCGNQMRRGPPSKSQAKKAPGRPDFATNRSGLSGFPGE